MYALAWQDSKLKTLISNAGTTYDGVPAKKDRHTIIQLNGEDETTVITRVVPRPKMVEEFFQFFSAIDIHDHLRQGSLRLEEAWKTKKWKHRVFSTIFGVIVTDAYYLYTMMKSRAYKALLSYPEFVERLALQLISNSHLESNRLRKRSDPDIEIDDNCNGHHLSPIRNLPQYKQKFENGNPNSRVRLRCRVCGNQSPWYCPQCSDISNPQDMKIACLCNITNSKCFMTYHTTEN